MSIKSAEKNTVHQTSINKTGLSRILGTSRMVTQLKMEIEEISSCDVSVLVTGASGTGKELSARAIHDLSPRAAMPFVAVNCGAIPENLVENELFGHRKGAYTDASVHQEGLVKEAEGGTLFLDEIGTISPYIQIKLLRLLQEKEYKPLGDPKPRKANIRILAATNCNLKDLVEEGKFREDLYFRLNIVSLYTPNLRERREDIPLLTQHFVGKYAAEFGKPTLKISREAMNSLISYSWPGNIRELENKIQYLMVMSPEREISPEQLQLSETVKTESPSFVNVSAGTFECFKSAKRKAIESFEKDYLIRLLTEYRGDLIRAAQTAGKSRTAFWNLLAKHRLSPGQFSPFGD
ncbi:MAG: sigma-54-dependent Fis family transcriptional regulator [bacterium]|nr:sigma-54-dependent Fis family transcriptional regulator [bacterium]